MLAPFAVQVGLYNRYATQNISIYLYFVDEDYQVFYIAAVIIPVTMLKLLNLRFNLSTWFFFLWVRSCLYKKNCVILYSKRIYEVNFPKVKVFGSK